MVLFPYHGGGIVAGMPCTRTAPAGAIIGCVVPPTAALESPKPSGLFLRRFPAQVFLSGSVHADHFAVGNEQRHHDLEARFELCFLP